MYRHNSSTEDPTLTIVHNAYTHLEKTGSFVQILFIDFSSTFNTIQPHLMASKFLKLNVNPRLILCIVDFLVSHSQTVHHQAVLSSSHSIATGSSQGTVLSPVRFTLYINDCTGTDTTPVIKNSDSSAVEDLSSSDSVYFAEVKRFSNWCRYNSLDLHVKKTKEMLIDFRKAQTDIPDLFIDGVKVERVTEYKYLGTVLDNKLNFNKNTDFIHKRC